MSDHLAFTLMPLFLTLILPPSTQTRNLHIIDTQNAAPRRDFEGHILVEHLLRPASGPAKKCVSHMKRANSAPALDTNGSS